MLIGFESPTFSNFDFSTSGNLRQFAKQRVVLFKFLSHYCNFSTTIMSNRFTQTQHCLQTSAQEIGNLQRFGVYCFLNKALCFILAVGWKKTQGYGANTIQYAGNLFKNPNYCARHYAVSEISKKFWLNIYENTILIISANDSFYDIFFDFVMNVQILLFEIVFLKHIVPKTMLVLSYLPNVLIFLMNFIAS